MQHLIVSEYLPLVFKHCYDLYWPKAFAAFVCNLIFIFILFTFLAFTNCQILTCVVRSQCVTLRCRLGQFLHSLRCSFAWVTVWSLFTMLFISSDTVFILFLYIVSPHISYDWWRHTLNCHAVNIDFIGGGGVRLSCSHVKL